jgi:hypothetical protein
VKGGREREEKDVWYQMSENRSLKPKTYPLIKI